MTFTVLFYLSRLAVRAFQFHFKRSNPEIEYFILYHELPHRLKEKYILKLHVSFNLLAPKPKQLAEVKKWLAHSAFPASEWHAPIADMIAHTPAEALEARATIGDDCTVGCGLCRL